MRRIVFCVLFVLLGLGPAWAKGDVQGDLNAAVLDFKEGRYGSALTAFRVILPSTTDPKLRADILWNIARSLEELDRPRDALIAFEQFAEETKGSDAAAKISKLTARVFGSVAVECGGQAWSIRLEGQNKTEQPCPTVFTRVEPGSVVVIARAGTQDAARAVTKVVAGQSAEVDLAAIVAAGPSPPDDDSNLTAWILGATGLTLAVGAGVYFLLGQEEEAGDSRVLLVVDDASQGLLRR